MPNEHIKCLTLAFTRALQKFTLPLMVEVRPEVMKYQS